MKLHPLPADDAAVLDAMPDCRAVDLLLPDCNGLLRGKRITREAFAKVYRDGVCLPMSLIATDINGNTVEETGLGYDIGDEDRICRPVKGSLRPVPWQDKPMAQCLLEMEDGHGELFPGSPREVLKRVVSRFTARGLTPVVAVELEFYLFDRTLGADGRPRTAINPATRRRDDSTQVYYIQDLVDHQDFLDAVARACEAQSIPADTAVAEYAPGQFEINLRHRPDAVLACDDAIYLKRAIKAIAGQHGMLASFMAKPVTGQSGSGAHLHVSVLDRAGNNIFASEASAPCDALRHAVGGLQATRSDCMLMFAPHANSYRRFVPGAFVPLSDTWGFNNRTVALRIPYSNGANTRIEHRIAGADSNPYLLAAGVLAGMLHGIEQRLESSAPVVGNAYEQTGAADMYWRDAIRDFQASEFVASALGSEFRHIFGQQKLKEMKDFHREISSTDIDWYLRQV